jgi:peptidoglycan hydrolase CwlO-like protein
MTKRDEEDAGLAIVSGGFGALLGYGSAQKKIQGLEAEKRTLQSEIFMLRNTLSAKDNAIAELQAENRKLKEEQMKNNNSTKSSLKSLFDKF